jgi:biopolymer transport protein ExbD
MHRRRWILLLVTTLSCRRSEERVRADPTPVVSASSDSAAPAPSPVSIPLDPAPQPGPTNVVVVSIDKKDRIYFGGRPVTETELETEAKTAVTRDPEVRVALAADKDARHGTVVAVLDRLRTAGIKKIGMMVGPTDAGPSP